VPPALSLKHDLHFAHVVYVVQFVSCEWVYKQIAIVSLYNTNQFVFVMETFGSRGLVLLSQLVG